MVLHRHEDVHRKVYKYVQFIRGGDVGSSQELHDTGYGIWMRMFTVKTVLSGDVSTWKQISHDMTSCRFFESILGVLGDVLSTIFSGAVGVSQDKEHLTHYSCSLWLSNTKPNRQQGTTYQEEVCVLIPDSIRTGYLLLHSCVAHVTKRCARANVVTLSINSYITVLHCRSIWDHISTTSGTR